MAIGQSTSSSETAPIVAEKSISWWQIGLLIYIIGGGLLIIRNLAAYYHLIKLVRGGKTFYSIDGVKLISNDAVKSPFTVMNYILLDNKDLSITEEKLIIKHEITHVKQKHWIDLICGQCMLVLQWFNPFVWLYVSLLKENHEFLADRAVLEDGTSPALYQAVLINRQFGGPVFSFSNSFNYSKPLTRLIMMKKTKSSPIRKMALLTLIPAFGVFMWATAKPNYIVEYTSLTDKTEILQDTAKATVTITETQVTGKYDADPALRLKGTMVMNDDTPPLIIIDGKEYNDVNISMLDTKYIKSINVLKGKNATDKYGNKGKNGVMEIMLEEGYDYSALKKGSNTKNVRVGISIANDKDESITVYNSEEDFELANIDTIKSKNDEALVISSLKLDTKIFWTEDGEGPPLVILEDKEISFDKMGTIDTNSIESMTVLKDKTAQEKYGEKAKNGVIIIKRKK